MADNDLNLQLGKGKLYFARFAAGTQTPGGERFIGNCSEVTVNAEIQTIEHRSSTEGRNKKDFEAVTGVDRAGSIVTDNRGLDNVGVFALGMVVRTTIASATGTIENFTGVGKGLFYQLGVTSSRPEGVRKVTSVVVTDGHATTPTTYVAGTDYTLDADRGRIGVASGGAIPANGPLKVTYNVTAHSIDRIVAGAEKQEGTLRWVATNPDGPLTDYFFPWVKLAPNGDLALVSAEEFLNLNFGVEVMEKGDLPPWIATGQAITA